MKNITRHTGIVTDVNRVDISRNGNPRYGFVIDGYYVQTAVDSSHGYSITNYEGKEVEVTIGSHYGTTTLDSIKLKGPIKLAGHTHPSMVYLRSRPHENPRPSSSDSRNSTAKP